jgi:hypothetical protein
MFSFFRRPTPLRAIPFFEATLAKMDPNDPSEEDLLIFGIFGSAHSFWDNLNRLSGVPAKFKSDGTFFEVAIYLLFRAHAESRVARGRDA